MRLDFSWIIEGKLAGHQAPSSEQDLKWLKGQGILALVRMAEKKQSGVNSLQVEHLGLEDCHEPVTDFAAPTPAQIDGIIRFIVKSLSAGRPVGVSCRAGLGRTGTILACYLVNQCYGADGAINEVRQKRPGSIETDEQERAIKDYAKSMGKT